MLDHTDTYHPNTSPYISLAPYISLDSLLSSTIIKYQPTVFILSI